MKYASEDLINEHQGILFGLQILEKMLDAINKKQLVEIEDIKNMINFLKLFADKCHHGKEEGLLFPAMEALQPPNLNGPIQQMLFEHTEGRKYIALMAESISDNLLKEAGFITAATGYIRLLRTHIEKENTILFPMGDRLLPASEQSRLLEDFEKFEAEVMGPGIHEKLHKMLDEFENKYLQNEV
jgi:hemerythrin-like domain-containing protein